MTAAWQKGRRGQGTCAERLLGKAVYSCRPTSGFVVDLKEETPDKYCIRHFLILIGNREFFDKRLPLFFSKLMETLHISVLMQHFMKAIYEQSDFFSLLIFSRCQLMFSEKQNSLLHSTIRVLRTHGLTTLK